MPEVARTSLDKLVLFDSLCNLCNSAVRFVIRHDKQAVFRFVPVQSERGRMLCRSCGLDPDVIQTVAVIRNGRCYVRSDAALVIAEEMGGLWRLTAVFRLVPVGLRDWLYTLIARNRRRWFGRADECLIPPDDVNRRSAE